MNSNITNFNDLEFDLVDHFGIRAVVEFDNGYGASVVQNKFSYGGTQGLYEIAVLDSDKEITYTTSVTNDVLGYLSKDEVSGVLEQISKL